MKIELKLFASLRKYHPLGREDDLLDCPDGATPGQIISRLNIPDDLAKIVFVNGRKAERTTVLKDGDRLGIFPPLAGG